MPEAGGIDLGALTRRVEQLGGFRPQSTYISQCMSPRRNWDSPNPSLASDCALSSPPDQGWGANSPASKWVVEPQFRRLEKRLSILPTL